MRWKHEPKQSPEDGATRTRTAYAWFPCRVDGHTVWLEVYAVDERYRVMAGPRRWEGWIPLRARLLEAT